MHGHLFWIKSSLLKLFHFQFVHRQALNVLGEEEFSSLSSPTQQDTAQLLGSVLMGTPAATPVSLLIMEEPLLPFWGLMLLPYFLGKHALLLRSGHGDMVQGLSCEGGTKRALMSRHAWSPDPLCWLNSSGQHVVMCRGRWCKGRLSGSANVYVCYWVLV